jgi:hypothetical protein
MAVFKPVISTIGYGPGNGLELFVAEDIYRYDVDNRPLENLADNDVAIKDSVDGIVDEIEDSYTGTLWPDGTPNTFSALDGRLDNMDIFLAELFEIRNVQYSSFIQFSSFMRERFTSGFMNGPYPDQFIRSNFSMENNEAMPSPFGGFYVPENALKVQDPEVPDTEIKRQVSMETRIEQDGSSTWRAKRKPLYVHVNGWIVPFMNVAGGTADITETTDDNRAAGNWGPVTINFPPAPSSGHRFDFAFLEVWLEEVEAGADWFYPYGSRDWLQWGQENLFTTAGSSTGPYAGQIDDRRHMVTDDETGWEFYVLVRDTPTAPGDRVDWTTVTPDAYGNGSGAIVDNGSGFGISGTLDYNNCSWTLSFTTPPADGKYVVAAMRTRAVEDPDNEYVTGTITFLPNGNYLQIQHRIRVVPGVDYGNAVENYRDWFSDPTVVGRGPKAEGGVATYTFINSLNDFHDGSMYHCGSGNTTSKNDLGTYDGYIYAIPLCAWSRFNTQTWSYTNQNGGVDRPDGLHYDVVNEKQFLDLRPVVLAERYDMNAAAENTLERIMRGDHYSMFAEALTDYEDSGDPADLDGKGIWGAQVPELWRVYQRTGLALHADINTVRDIGLATSADYNEVGFPSPRAWHDGIRQIFSPQEEVQQVPVSIDDVTGSNNCGPAPLITYDYTTHTITLTTNDVTLSGYSAVAGQGALINDSYPRLFWRGSRQPVILSTQWSGLGTNTATAVIDSSATTYETNGIVDGFVDVLYPECTGIGRPLKQIDHVEFHDGVNNYVTQVRGNDDGSPDTADIVDWKLNLATPLEPGFNLPTGVCHDTAGNYIFVCDSANNRVVKLDATDLTHVAQWPTLANYPVDMGSYNSATDLKYPVDVAVDASDNVYVVDRDDHRMVKLNSTLTTKLAEFGTSGVPTNDPEDDTELNSPEGVTVDGAGNVFIADTGLYRLVKLNSGLTYQTHMGDGFSGAGKGQFIAPGGLDVGNIGGDDYVYVADQNRIVQVDATQMTVENILGDRNTNTIEKFDRYTSGIGGTHSWWGYAEDADGNRYVTNNDRANLLKLDANWNLIATFGEDNVRHWIDKEAGTGANRAQQKHLNWSGDLIYDSEANLIYVGDNIGANQDPADNNSRLLIFNLNLELQDILYLGTTNFTKRSSGLAFKQDAGTGAKLYMAGGNQIIKLALPVPGSRADASLWSEDWLLDNTSTGFTGASQLRHCHDIDINAAGTYLWVTDIMRGELIKIDTSTKLQVGSRTDLGYDWATIPTDPKVGSAFFCLLSPDENHVYVSGGWDVGHSYHHIRVVDASTMAISERWVDDTNWLPNDVPYGMRYNYDKSLAYVFMDEETLVYDVNASSPWFNVSGSGPGDIAGSFDYNLADLPVSIDLELDIPWINCRAVHAKDDVLYVADPEANTLVAVNMDSLRVLGVINSPAMVGIGKASTAGPAGVCVIDQEIFFCDMLNNRTVKGYRRFPSVERGTGRLQYLIAPADSMSCTFQARYTPYQGQWRYLDTIGPVYGRHFVNDSNLMYVTTMGRGTPTKVSPASGTSFYSNMISHLPNPVDIPSKGAEGKASARITNEYLFAPELLPLAGGPGQAPFLRLPVLNRYPASAQQMQPWYGGGSRFDFNRFFFNQGAGSGNASDSAGTDLEDPALFTNRGYETSGLFTGFDTLMTFSLDTLSIPRLLFSTMVVELDGQGYLLVYASYRAAAGNIINDGSPVVADVYRLYGNPGVKTRY